MLTFDAMKSISQFFNRVFQLDLRSLALLRIGVASVLIYDLLERWTDLGAHYTDAGILPREALWKFFSSWNLTFHSMSGAWQIEAILFVIAFAFAIMLLLGYKTRVVTIVCWVFLISLQNRNPVVCFGGDSVLRMLLFWGMFLPWGARFAFDTVAHGLKAGNNKIVGIGNVGYAVQICCIYIFTALLKTGAEWREDFTAVYYAVSLDELKTPLTDFLYDGPAWILTFLTVAVVIWEGLGTLLLLTPKWRVRLFGVIGFVLLHIGFGMFMRLGIFPFVSAICVVGFLPGEMWDRLGRRWHRKRQNGLVIYYDGTCGFCAKFVALTKVFLILPSAQIRAGAEDEKAFEIMQFQKSWVVVDAEENHFTDFAAFIRLMKASPWARFLAPIFNLFSFLGRPLYFKLSKRRDHLPLLAETKNPFKKDRGPLVTAIGTFCILFVVAINVVIVFEDDLTIPPGLKEFAQTSKITQNWGMFAPYPYKSDGWYVIPGELRDGTRLDLFTGNEVDFEKPERVSAMFKTTRWSKYYRSLRRPKYRKLMPYYIKYMVRDWNRNHEPEEWINEFRMVFMREKTLPDYEVAEPEEIVLWRYKRPRTGKK